MDSGVDVRLYVTCVVVVVLFIVLPGLALEYERRKREYGAVFVRRKRPDAD